MTDFSAAQPGPRSAYIPAATRAKPADALDTLRGRILLQVSPQRVSAYLEHVYTPRSGLVVSGKRASEKIAELRQDSYVGVALADPALYREHRASEDEPFIAAAGQPSFFGELADALSVQLNRGADFALSPTGYIDAEDSGALKAAARAVIELGDPRMVFVVPASATWLRKEEFPQLIAVLQRVPGAKALMLGGQMDPLKGSNGPVANLCRVIAAVPGIALMRTDIAAFGAIAHGAAFSAFGTGTSQRHIVPPGEKAATVPVNQDSPSVLYPELMAFFKGGKIADRFAGHEAPACDCGSCAGRALDRFDERATESDAISHNVAVMMGWGAELEAAAGRTDPRVWWQQRCAAALGRYGEVNTQIGQPKAFQPPSQLSQWATSVPTPDEETG